MQLVNNSMTAAHADTVFDRADLKIRPPNNILSQRPPKMLSNQLYWVRQGTVGTFLAPNGTPGQFAKSFFLSDVFNAADWQKVFDQYCIFAVVITFQTATIPGTTNNMGQITTVIDFTDINNLSSQSEAKSYTTAITEGLSVGKAITRYLEPCVSQNLFQSVAVNGYGPQRCWIDISSPNIPHFGVKAIVTDNSLPLQIQVTTEYILGFRNSK